MNPVEPVTLEDVAREAGVSRAAVSMGLRDHPRISAGTRLRIRDAAARLGYVADPAISHLMSYMRRRMKPTPPSVLAYLADCYPAGWMNGYMGAIFRGASERASALGYHLERLALNDRSMTGARLEDIVRARGIEGMLIGAFVDKPDHLNLDCSSLATVALSGNLWEPPLHRVHSDYHYNTLSMARHLMKAGYRRIGLVTSTRLARHTEHQEEGAFLAVTQTLRVRDRPLFSMTNWDEDAFRKWFQHHSPDALMTAWLEIIPALESLGLSVPGDVGVAFNWIPEGMPLSGMRQDFHAIGATGVDLLDLLLRGHEKGYPTHPKSILIRGTWVEGTTVRMADGPAMPSANGQDRSSRLNLEGDVGAG